MYNIDKILEFSGLKKSIYSHLQDINLLDFTSYCKSEEFNSIIQKYCATSKYCSEKKQAIEQFIQDCFTVEKNNLITKLSIEYFSVDLDFLSFSLPYFSRYFSIKEIHELHYLLKKVVVYLTPNSEQISLNYLTTLFFDTELSNEDCFWGERIEKINWEILINSEKYLKHTCRHGYAYAFRDWRGEPVALKGVPVTKFVCSEILNDLGVFKKILEKDYFLIKYIGNALINNIDLFNYARTLWVKNKNNIKKDSRLFESFHPIFYFKLLNNREVAFQSVQDIKNILKFLNHEFKNDFSIVYSAVSKNGLELKDASERLKDDFQIASAAIYNNIDAWEYVSEILKKNKNFVLNAAKQIRGVIKYVGEKMKTDKDVALAAISIDSEAITHVSENLKLDKEIMLCAISKYIGAIKYIPDNLKHDKEVILAGVTIDGEALAYASEKLRDNKYIVIQAIKKNPLALKHASLRLQNDINIVLLAVNLNKWALEFASDNLKEDIAVFYRAFSTKKQIKGQKTKDVNNIKEIIIQLVKQDGMILKCLSENFKNDKEVVCAAIAQNAKAINFAGDLFRDDESTHSFSTNINT